MAAPWLRTLTPRALLDRLRAHQRRPLQLLTGGARDAPARQQTLRTAIAWSYDLLAPDEQILFRRLVVFPGGFTVEAAEAIAGQQERDEKTQNPPAVDVLDGIASLVDKSLVQQVVQPDGGARFRILETIREFGLEHLAASDETEATMRRLANWCQDLLEGAEAAFFTATQGEWVGRLETEHDNLRAVLDWAVQRGDAATAQHLVERLAFFWYPRGYLSEGRNWGERALALGDGSSTPERAATLALTGTIAQLQGEHRRARELAVEGLTQSRQVGHVFGEGNALLVLGWTAGDEGRFDEADAHLSEALRHFQTHGNATWVGFSLNSLGVVAYERGDIAQAAVRFAEAHDSFRAIGNTYGIGVVLTNLAKIAREQGDYARAAALYAESLVLRHEQGEKQSMAGGLRGLASVAAAARQYERAARLWGAAEALREAIGAPPPRHHIRAQHAIAATQRGLGEGAFAAAWAAGRSLPLAAAVAEALHASADGAERPRETTPSDAADRHGLTPRELDVLRLLPRGLTNREIGDALFIDERTVATHAHNIFAKWGVTTRAEAAALGVERGLV